MHRISPEDHARVSAAVHAAEKQTSGEIVTVVAARSDSYHDIVLIWAMAAVFAVLAGLAALPAPWLEAIRAMILGWQARIDHHELLFLLFAALAVTAMIARWLAGLWPVRMALTPRGTKARRVRARALDYFRIGAEKRTKGHTAVLIYVSLAEHQVEIIADKAIHSLVPPESWGHAAAVLVEAMRDNRPGDGLVEAVRHVGTLLAQHFPPVEGNPNELPDRLIEVGSH